MNNQKKPKNKKAKNKKAKKVQKPQKPSPFDCKDKCLYQQWKGFTWGEVAKRDPHYVITLIKYGKYVPKVLWDYFVDQIDSGYKKDKERRAAAENCYRQKRYATQDKIFQ